MNSIEQIKRIREQYGFPIWLINEALKYYNNDENKTIERLKEHDGTIKQI